MIEFALILPFILIVLFLIIEFGQVFNHLNDLNQIAANGARFAAVDNNPGGGTLQEYLAAQAGTQRLRDDIKVCVEQPDGNLVGAPVVVSTSSSYDLLPIIAAIAPVPTLELKGSATMRIERPMTQYVTGC